MVKSLGVREIFRAVVLVGFFWGTGVGVAAAQNVIVETDYVLSHKDKPGVVLVDSRGAADYKKGMIPGAVILGEKDARTGMRDVSGRILPVKQLEKMLGDAGLTRESEVIVYGAKADTNPDLVFWILEYFGSSTAKVYHGGIDDWKAGKHPIVNEPRKLPVAQFTAKLRPELIATTDFVKKNLKNKEIQFIDSRTAKEHAGIDVRAVRGGYIPAVNQVNIPYEMAWKDPEAGTKPADKKVEGMTLKDAAGLKELYKGVDPKKEVVAYCQTGIRSTQTYVVLRNMGYQKVRNYDDSWIIWGSDASTPIANETYYDFVKVNAAMSRLDALEQQVAGMKK